VLAALLAIVWLVTWQYAAAYEDAQPAAALDAYVEQTLTPALEAQIEQTGTNFESPYESADTISEALSETLLGGNWSYREDAKQSTDEAPVYTLYCGGVPMSTAHLTVGKPRLLSFGFSRWEVSGSDADLRQLSKTVIVYAPADSGAAINGVPLQTAPEAEAIKQYPRFAEYEALIGKSLELQQYTVENLFAAVSVTAADGFTILEQDSNTYYVIPVCDDKTHETLLTFTEDFVGAYIDFTSNAMPVWNLQRYVHLRSEFYQRIYKSLDGMSWVSGVTGKLAKLELHDLVYYGNVATCEADYFLDMKKTDDYEGSMHIVMARTSSNWRVVNIEMY